MYSWLGTGCALFLHFSMLRYFAKGGPRFSNLYPSFYTALRYLSGKNSSLRRHRRLFPSTSPAMDPPVPECPPDPCQPSLLRVRQAWIPRCWIPKVLCRSFSSPWSKFCLCRRRIPISFIRRLFPLVGASSDLLQLDFISSFGASAGPSRSVQSSPPPWLCILPASTEGRSSFSTSLPCWNGLDPGEPGWVELGRVDVIQDRPFMRLVLMLFLGLG